MTLDLQQRINLSGSVSLEGEPNNHSHTHRSWLLYYFRFNDVSPSVRVECIRYSKYFLVYHPHLAAEVAQHLHDRFHDKDEKVRMESVKVVSEAAADNSKAVPKAVSSRKSFQNF